MAGVLRGFGWTRVLLDAVTTLALAALFYLLVSVTVDPMLRTVVLGGGRLIAPASGDLLDLVGALSFLVYLAASLLALMAGSLVASGLYRLYPGLRGAVSAALVARLCLRWCGPRRYALAKAAGKRAHRSVYEIREPGQVVALGVFGFVAGVPAVMVSGYLGGRFGQPLLGRIAGR